MYPFDYNWPIFPKKRYSLNVSTNFQKCYEFVASVWLSMSLMLIQACIYAFVQYVAYNCVNKHSCREVTCLTLRSPT